MAKAIADKAIYDKQYSLENKERISKRMKQYYIDNRDKINESIKQYKINNEDKVKEKNRLYSFNNKERIKQYQSNRKDKRNLYMSNRRRYDINYRLRINLSSRIYNVFKGVKGSKSTIKLLGCSIKELRQWIESQFTEGMSWDNYGINGWELDHVYPVSKFNLEQPYEQKIAFNWFNMQPLWVSDNRSKHNKLYE